MDTGRPALPAGAVSADAPPRIEERVRVEAGRRVAHSADLHSTVPVAVAIVVPHPPRLVMGEAGPTVSV